MDPHKHLVSLQSVARRRKQKQFSETTREISDDERRTYLTGCSNMARNSDVDGEARFKGTSSGRFAVFVEIIVSFKIKYA